jgi:hypothetical protein
MQAKAVRGVPEGAYEAQALPIFKAMVSHR